MHAVVSLNSHEFSYEPTLYGQQQSPAANQAFCPKRPKIQPQPTKKLGSERNSA